MDGMNLAAQASSIILLLVIMLMYVIQRRPGLRSERAFIILWAGVLFSVLSDIVAIYAYYNKGAGELSTTIALKVFVLSEVIVGLALFLYFCGDIFTEMTSGKITVAVVTLFFFASVSMLALESNGAVKDPYSEWTRLMVAGGVILMIIFAAMIIIVLICRKSVKTEQRVVMYFFIFGWIATTAFQAFFPGLIANSFFCATGVLVIYTRLENPLGYTDVVSGMFNQTAFLRYCRERIRRGDELSFLCVEVDRKSIDNIPSDKTEQILKSLVSFFIETPGALAFRMPEDRVILVFKSKKDLRAGYEYLRGVFSRIWDEEDEIRIKAIYIEIPFGDLDIKLEDISPIVLAATQSIGKSRYMIIDRAFVEGMHRSHIVRDIIDEALEEDRIEVFYQPIYSISKQRFVSAEALIRIRNKDGSLTYPGDFIPVAEKSEQIIKLGEKVFEKVCEFIANEDINKKGIEYIEVNLSVVQCDYLFLANSFMEIMRRFNIDPNMINLEITESAGFSDKETMIRNIDILRSCGVRFSLDDFGTGQSNLNYIVDMPVDIVKFDREMTWSYFENTKARYVMETSVSMIHGMDLQIVTEGVENEKQYHILKDLGIDFIQGYYLAKPLSSRSFLEFIA